MATKKPIDIAPVVDVKEPKIRKTIQGVSYFKIVSSDVLSNKYTLNPYDLNGNLFSNVTIECDLSLGQVYIHLPSINDGKIQVEDPTYPSLKGNFNIAINISISNQNDAYSLAIYAADDFISGKGSIQLNEAGSSVILKPITSNAYSVLITQ